MIVPRCCWCGRPFEYGVVQKTPVYFCGTPACFRRCLTHAVSINVANPDRKSGVEGPRCVYFPLPKQVEVIEAVESHRYRHILTGGSAGGSKALALDTLIPTPTGWTTMGAVEVGDLVMGADRLPTRVEGVTPVLYGRDCFRVTFSDGESVVCDAGHLWLTMTARERGQATRRTAAWRTARKAKRSRRGRGVFPWLTTRNEAMVHDYLVPPSGMVRTTRALSETVNRRQGGRNHSVRPCEPWMLEAGLFPVPPYVLGVWLGDGNSLDGHITIADTQIRDEVEREGIDIDARPATRYRYGTRGLYRPLRLMGVLGNKHVPEGYLRGSFGQRLSLLQGLMDTDGSINATGSASFTNTNRGLVEAVRDLAVSLGDQPPQIAERRAKLYGRDCGPVYSLKWTPRFPIFRLARKLARLSPNRPLQRYVVSVEPVPSVPVRCIEVSDPSGLFLVSRSAIPTHNSHGLRWLHYLMALKHPGFRSLILRRTFPELETTHILRAETEVKPLGGEYGRTSRMIRWGNASLTRFGHSADPDEVTQHLSAEWDLISRDELVTFEEQQAKLIGSRARTTRDDGWVACTVDGTNPGGPEAAWVKQWYLDKDVDREEYPDYEPDQYLFIRAGLEDNPYLGEDYERTLRDLPPMLRKAYLEGSWDIWPGQFFPEWDRKRHVAEWAGFNPVGARVFCGIDWGYINYGTCLWAAVTNDGKLYVFDEYNFKMTVVSEVAREIARRSREWGVRPTYVADTQMWGGADQTGEDMAETMARFRVPLIQANKDRVNGWARMRHWLKDAPDGTPWMQVHPRCVQLARTIPQLQSDKHKPEDVDGDGGANHWGDAIRYLIGARPAPGMLQSAQRFPSGSFGALLRRERASERHGLLGR